MEVIRTFYKYKCLECGKKIILFDLVHNEFYCRSCGLIHNLEMLNLAKNEYYKDKLKEIQKSKPDIYNLIQMDLKQQEKEKIKLKLDNKNKNKLKQINYLLYGSSKKQKTKIK